MKTIALVKLLCVLAVLVTTPGWSVRAQTQQNLQTEPRASAGQTRGLSPEAAQVADEIGVTTLLNQPGIKGTAGSPMSLQSLVARQEITEKVLAASLDVDSVNAVIDSEVEQLRSIRSDLQSQRDKAQNIINVASIVTGGAFGAVTSAMQFKPRTVTLGNGIGVAGGVGSVLLSIVGIRKQSGGRRDLGDSPRMLARFFGRRPDATEAIPSFYPDEIWSYLNSTSPSQAKMGTRREQLIAKWQSEGRIKQDGSPKGELKIESLSGNLSQTRRLNIDELGDRIAMLLDVRARVSLIKRALSEIMRGLSAVNNQ
jgi:hypothetical protein